MNENLLYAIIAIYEIIARLTPTEKNYSIVDFVHNLYMKILPNKAVTYINRDLPINSGKLTSVDRHHVVR
jgi:hypothetical protein